MRKAFPITDANRRWWIATATGVSLALLLGDDIMVGVALRRFATTSSSLS